MEFKHTKTCPHTVIFLLRDAQVLLIKRNALKRVNPNKISGLGGEVEQGETFLEAAQRELEEESGLVAYDLSLKGTLTIIDNLAISRVLYIYVGYKFEGELKKECSEGKLNWYDCSNIPYMNNIAIHQRLFIGHIINSSDSFYSGIVFCDCEKILYYTDSTNC